MKSARERLSFDIVNFFKTEKYFLVAFYRFRRPTDCSTRLFYRDVRPRSTRIVKWFARTASDCTMCPCTALYYAECDPEREPDGVNGNRGQFYGWNNVRLVFLSDAEWHEKTIGFVDYDRKISIAFFFF